MTARTTNDHIVFYGIAFTRNAGTTTFGTSKKATGSFLLPYLAVWHRDEMGGTAERIGVFVVSYNMPIAAFPNRLPVMLVAVLLFVPEFQHIELYELSLPLHPPQLPLGVAEAEAVPIFAVADVDYGIGC